MGLIGFLPTFFHSQLLVTPTHPTTDFTGKTVIVTGSNVGLGLEAARHFVRLNCAKLIIAVRTASKGQAAKESILSSTKRTDDCIEVWELDLGNNASVKAFAKRAQSLERVDALVENAGISTNNFNVAEGHEMSLQVNVFGTFLLALLMLPKLRETEEKYNSTPHLAIVSSEVHNFAGFKERNEEDIYAKLDSEKDFNAQDR
jgi:retinol dehydrogenase-12